MNVHTESFRQIFKKEGNIWHAYFSFLPKDKDPIELLHLTNTNRSILQKEFAKRLYTLSLEINACAEEAKLPDRGFINGVLTILE